MPNFTTELIEPTTLTVRYHNDINMIPLGYLSEAELDIFFTICSKVKYEETHTVELDFTELRKLSGYSKTSNEEFAKQLDRINKKLITIQVKIDTPSELTRFVIFPKFKIDRDNKFLTVAVADEFVYMLNELQNNFTRFELEEFVSVKGKYAKRIYCLLKQFRQTGIWRIELDAFKNKMGIPKSYRLCHIDEKILNPTIKELSKVFNNLHIDKVKRYGGKVIGLEFTFNPEKTRKTLSKPAAKPQTNAELVAEARKRKENRGALV